MINEKIILSKTWRSEFARIFVFIGAIVSAPILSEIFPGSIITGKLFTIGDKIFYLSLPLYWLTPLTVFLDLVARVYNVRYIIDAQGIEAWDGIVSLRQSITRVRHEDVRSIETDQNIMERLLDIGEVAIGTAATGGVEILFQGVESPKKLQQFLQAERDEVQKRSRRSVGQQESTQSDETTRAGQ